MSKPDAPLLSRRDSDLLRTAASTLVILAHCTNLWVRDFYAHRDFASAGFWITLLDQLTRFTVPAFFLLSGYGLTQQVLARPEGWLAFYRRRVLKIAAPFFAWSALTIYRPWPYLKSLPWAENPWQALAGFFDFLLLKGFDYQYYFLIVIFQFYLVFPLLFRLARSRAFVFACLALQLAVMSPVEGYLSLAGWKLPKLYSHLLLFYGVYFVLGVHAAWHRDLFSGLLSKVTRAQLWVFWAGALALTFGEFWVNISVMKKPLAYADHFNRWVVLLYCFATLLLLLKYREPLRTRVHEHPRWQFLYVWFTPFSFFVYLAHTHFLRLADLFLRGLNPGLIPARIAFVIALSYLTAWGLQRLLKNLPKVRLALGLPAK